MEYDVEDKVSVAGTSKKSAASASVSSKNQDRTIETLAPPGPKSQVFISTAPSVSKLTTDGVSRVGEQQATTSKDEKNHWAQLALLLAGTSFFGNGTLGITKSFLSVYLKSMGFSSMQIGFVAGARGFKAIADLLAGYFSDKFGRKKVAYIGQLFLVISHISYGCVHSLSAFITSGLLHGVGSGFNAGAATFGAADLMKKSKGLGQGILELANYLSQTIFALIAGFFVLKLGLASPFIILGLMPIFGMFIVWRYLKEPRDVVAGHKHKHITLKEVTPFIKQLMTNPKMISVFYAGFLSKFVDDGILKVLMPLHALAQGHTVLAAAALTTVSHVALTAAQLPAGWLSDKIGRKPCLLGGTLLLGAAAVAMPYFHSTLLVNLMGIAIGVGNGLIYPAAPAATADVVPDDFRATGIGIYKFTHDVGVFVGPALMGGIIQFAGSVYAFLVAGAIIFVGSALLGVFYKDNAIQKS